MNAKVDWDLVALQRFSELNFNPAEHKYERIRFYTTHQDSRPVIYPAPGPWWESGYDENNRIVVAYFPTDYNIKDYWPEAYDIHVIEEDAHIEYSSRFPKPSWWPFEEGVLPYVNKVLEWGETPFDKMSHDELLVHAKRMYSAIQSAHNELGNMREMGLRVDKHSLYWTGQGSGNIAFQKVDQALKKASNGYSRENIHHSYFRYAKSFLFDPWSKSDMPVWMICSKCGSLHELDSDKINRIIEVEMSHNEMYKDSNCDGLFQKLTADNFIINKKQQ
jgi:uncharacterized protein YukE